MGKVLSYRATILFCIFACGSKLDKQHRERQAQQKHPCLKPKNYSPALISRNDCRHKRSYIGSARDHQSGDWHNTERGAQDDTT